MTLTLDRIALGSVDMMVFATHISKGWQCIYNSAYVMDVRGLFVVYHNHHYHPSLLRP